jgi:hypothetical protein
MEKTLILDVNHVGYLLDLLSYSVEEDETIQDCYELNDMNGNDYFEMYSKLLEYYHYKKTIEETEQVPGGARQNK